MMRFATYQTAKNLTVILVCITISWIMFCIGYLSNSSTVRRIRNRQENKYSENCYPELMSSTIPSTQFVVTKDMNELKKRNEARESQEWTTVKTRLKSRNTGNMGFRNTHSLRTTSTRRYKNQEIFMEVTTSKTEHLIWNKTYNDKKDETTLNKSQLSEMKVNITDKLWCQEAYKFYPLAINFTQFIKDPSKFYVFPINKHPFDFIFNPIRVCSFRRDVFVLSVVKSRIDNFFLRSAIRATWGEEARKGNNRLVFLLGYSTDTKIMDIVHQEFVKYNDMIMEDFIDEYFNTTRKFMMAARWITKYCVNAKFVFLVDEDVMVNFANLVAYFRNISSADEETLLEGELQNNPKPFRSKLSKWYTTHEEYPFDCYLPYLSGAAILTSGIVVRKLNIVAPYVQFFKIDDVFLSIVAHRIGVLPRNNKQVCVDSCRFDLKNYITRHGFSNHMHYFKFGKLLNTNKRPMMQQRSTVNPIVL